MGIKDIENELTAIKKRLTKSTKHLVILTILCYITVFIQFAVFLVTGKALYGVLAILLSIIGVINISQIRKSRMLLKRIDATQKIHDKAKA